MNKGNRSIRLTAVAVGVFGFAASLTAFAGAAGWGCEHCLPIYYDCTAANPDNRDGCLADFWNCQTSNGCMITLPPDY